MVGLRLREALRANAIVFGALVMAALLGTMPTETATYLLFTLFCANIIGCAGRTRSSMPTAPRSSSIASSPRWRRTMA